MTMEISKILTGVILVVILLLGGRVQEGVQLVRILVPREQPCAVMGTE